MRAALYARYSSDLQKERSIEDQLALLRVFAARESLEIVAEYIDRARSGTSLFGRDGLMNLMEAARERQFDAVLVESLDRLSRDQADMAGLYKRLSFYRVEIRQLHEGVADEIHIGVRSIVSSLYIRDLKHKVKRGMAGVIRDGRRAGGLPYGYAPVLGKPGEMVIVEEQAEIVRRIFREYAGGSSAHTICAKLNAECIPSPRGGVWGTSTINGHRITANGILHNQVYIGKLVWNRVPKVKDPETGRMVPRPNASAEWQETEAPGLCIVDQALFDQVQALRKRLSGTPHLCRRPKHLFSGLLRCGACGASLSVQGRDRNGRNRVQCSAVRNSGTCSHSRKYYADDIARIVMSGMKNYLAHPDAIREFVTTYQRQRAERLKAESLSRIRLENQLGMVRRRISALVNALADGLASAVSVREKLLALEAEANELEGRISATPVESPIVTLHPAAMQRYLDLIDRLSAGDIDCLGTDSAEALRDFIAEIVVHPTSAGQPLSIDVKSRLSLLLGTDAPLAGRFGVNGGAGGGT